MQTWSTTVLTPLTYDTEPTVLVTFDNAKYIFNVGENTNRAFLQSRKNWKRMRGVFLTQVNSQRTSGLGGMLMSFADAGIKKLDVVGPPGLRHFLSSMRFYLYREQPDVTTTEVSSDQGFAHPEVCFKDDNVTVYSFPLTRLVPSRTGESTIEGAAESGWKRKRTSDVDSPSKIAKLAGRATRNLNPDDLRRTVIQHMFKPRQCIRNATDPAQEGESANLDDYRRESLPWWFYRQLPSFSFPSSFPHSSTLAYVVVGPRFRGKIDGKKLNELGVPFNELRRKLTMGETIRFEVKGPNGLLEARTVRPEDCMGKSDPAAAVIILDVPSVEMIPSLVQSFDTVYKPFRSLDPVDLEKHSVRVVYHLLGPGVLEDERYIRFMQGFPVTAEHIISSPEFSSNPVTFTSHGFNQFRLSQLDPEAFPLPKFNTSPTKSLTDVPSLHSNAHVMVANLHVPLRPPGPLQSDKSVPEDHFHSAFTRPEPLPESTSVAFAKAKEAILRHPEIESQQQSGVKVLPLGTGSAVPNKYRNVSSTLIKTPSGNILLDVGEGTLGQLTRRFGIGIGGDVDEVLANLKCIFVSHVHADHQMGLVKLLRRRRLLAPPPKHPLYVVSIRTVHLHLKEYHELEDIGLCDDPKKNGVVQVISDALTYNFDEYPTTGSGRVGGNESWLDLHLSRGNAREICRQLDLETFKTINVFHRTKAFGVYFKHKNGWSIAFSGDTTPTPNLPKEASGATLLIHEATMGDDQEELAYTKAHSTVGQAIQVARDMNAKNVLLTHFSARYPKMPPSIIAPLEESTSEQKEPLVTLAFDLAELDLDQMWKMNVYLPAIEKCFEDSTEEGDGDLYATVSTSIDG